MQTEPILILLFPVAAAVAIATRQLHVPYTVALVLTGLALGILNLFTPPHLTKELLFSVFLPGLLFDAAFHIEFREFCRNRLLDGCQKVKRMFIVKSACMRHLN